MLENLDNPRFKSYNTIQLSQYSDQYIRSIRWVWKGRSLLACNPRNKASARRRSFPEGYHQQLCSPGVGH